MSDGYLGEPWWERWLRIIVTSLLTPATVAVVGCNVQRALQQPNLARDYVGIAVSVLREEKVDADLRRWATETLNQHSPIKFGKTLKDKLEEGPVLPRWGFS